MVCCVSTTQPPWVVVHHPNTPTAAGMRSWEVMRCREKGMEGRTEIGKGWYGKQIRREVDGRWYISL
jgi:hypothetical protein